MKERKENLKIFRFQVTNYPNCIPEKPKLLNHLQALAQTTKLVQEKDLFT